MAAADFHLTTDWVFDAPIEAVWRALNAPEEWPTWWPVVANVERIAEGDALGVGAVRRMTWRTALPYNLVFDIMRLVAPLARPLFAWNHREVMRRGYVGLTRKLAAR